MRIPKKLADLKPYDPTEGLPEVKLDANESYIILPADIMSKVNSAVNEVLFNRYPDPSAKQLCDAAADYFGVKSEQVVAGNGSDELISVLVNSFLDKGSRILVTKPDFSMYAFYAEMAEIDVVSLEKEDRMINVDELISCAKKEKVSALFFSNPCNPTGTGISRSEVIRLAKSLPDVLVIADEAYMDFWDQSILGDIESLDNVIVLRTCSKAFGLAGIRLGFAIAREELADLIKKAKSPFNVNSVTQAIATVVLKEKEFLDSAARELTASRERLQEKLRELENRFSGKIKLLPSAANFVLLETAYAEEIFSRLKERDIVIRKFTNMLRITAGSELENAKFIFALKEILEDC